MEILHKGEDRSVIEYEHDCKECGTVFRFTEGESRKVQGFNDFIGIACPVCNTGAAIQKKRPHIETTCYLPRDIIEKVSPRCVHGRVEYKEPRGFKYIYRKILAW